MLGAIAGDIIGSVYEGRSIKSTDFPLFQGGSQFTDDTVLTLAIAHAVMSDGNYGQRLKEFGRKYPRAGYGGHFYQWIFEDEIKPYNSWGNGSAMRVSPIGFAFDETMAVLREAKRSAEVSHNHPEGIKGAQATAYAIYLARRGEEKDAIREEVSDHFAYDLQRTVKEIRPHYSFDVSCQGSVPEAIIAFLDSKDYEDAVRKAISLGGDSDTLACIAGGIAQTHYRDIPDTIVQQTRDRLPADLLKILDRFQKQYAVAY